ncbi:DUF4132 domain-containing protein [Lentzea flava]|uniref:DUF4132 domain-containing protein n=1 Tax=Lentzea flava TaxID=103732 RepID=A0ABQ2UMN7_9PSEU|nr:DUF4132 domain-containing protein [Lentzea flava]MCP2201837.1 protein of unknown function (DUF4132) [Lentzea flava]GGU45025.1 hypothetical protein GCM10010178_41960 [Lentzea flava]
MCSNVDENAWVMPAQWLRQAFPRRDARPVPEFGVDRALAQEFREHVAARGGVIEEVLAHPSSHPELVGALRAQLAGRPSPLGAAVLAKVAELGRSPVHWWIDEFGLPFAAAAAVHHGVVAVSNWKDWQTQKWSGTHLRLEPPKYLGDETFEARALIDARRALAAADSATYEEALAALEEVGATWFGQVARAFVAPTRHDWFDEAHAAEYAPDWMVDSSASTPEHLGRPRCGRLFWSPEALYSALLLLGPALAPVLDAELRTRSDGDADLRKAALEVLAALPTDEAFLILLNRMREKHFRPALQSAMAAFPVRAARLLAPRAAVDPDVRHLLRVHVLMHPDLELPPQTAALVAAAGFVTVPDAPPSALPRVLADPPWLRRRAQPKPVVLKDLPVPPAHLTWLPGEREEWREAGGRWTNHSYDWYPLAQAVRHRTHRIDDHRLFRHAPEELARPLLADWVPVDTWRGEIWGRSIAARFELDALPALRRVAAAAPRTNGVILLPYAAPEVAELMADWLVRLKSARAFAVEWLARHRETAARLLIPAALGAAGPRRHNAEFALRHLHLETGVDVIAVATSLQPQAGAAIRTLMEADPLDVLPPKLPAIDWTRPHLLPQVLLADRTAALSTEAAANLLLTAALSTPDAIYPGLPLAAEACDRESLAEFAWAVFGRWQDLDAPPKDSWALTALGWFGTDATVRRLAPVIRAWPGESGHAKAVTGLDVLARIGTEVALSHLNSIAERVKFKGLKTRAQEKIAQIAAELGLSRDQLADRLVPRLGLDDSASLVIDYGPRQFTVGFDEQLKPYVLDQDGKPRKDLPKPGAKDDQSRAPLEHKRFSTLKKDVRTIASDQIHRLERAMVNQRTWTAEEFHTVLAGHPLLWHLVRRLVWLTDESTSFRLAEDRTLATAADTEFTLPPNATVRVAHPVDLADTLKAWGDIFADYEILQPFPQLIRPTHAFTPAEPEIPQLREYLNRAAPVGRILGLTTRGWVRGAPQDNGVENWVTRPLPSGGALVATLDPGIATGAVDIYPEVKFSAIWFSETGEGTWPPPNDNTQTGIAIDPITASELLSELESLHA